MADGLSHEKSCCFKQWLLEIETWNTSAACTCSAKTGLFRNVELFLASTVFICWQDLVPLVPALNVSDSNTTQSPVVKIWPKCQQFIISQYVIPDVLHSLAYAYSFYLLRLARSEQLPTLMERVSLTQMPFQSHTTNSDVYEVSICQRKIFLFQVDVHWQCL